METREETILTRREAVTGCHDRLHGGDMDMTGWVDLPETLNGEELKSLKNAGNEIRHRHSALVVIGVGGSYLGTRACYEALTPQSQGVKLFFAGWNLSGRYHEKLLRELDRHDAALCVVSKSGTTIETTLAFDLLKDYMKKRYGRDFARRVYAVTDPKKGALREEAEKMGYQTFALDENIGGRYSVLTAVGLLPLTAAGYDVEALLRGAAKAENALNTADLSKNDAYRYAVFRNLMFEEGKSIEFFSFTEPEMIRFGDWLKQLFAESEGKDSKGIYPSVIGYSTDLHSVGQFLEEGNPVFFETMITLGHHTIDLTADGHEHGYNRHIDSVAEAVYRVRNEKGTPITRLTLTSLDEEHLGYLIYFFEKACAMSCMLMNVNPFDQPGVEAYKRELRALLSEE